VIASSKKNENSAAVRIAMRRARIAAREAIPAAEHRERSERLEARLEACLKTHHARMAPGCIGFCWPIRAEFDARPLVTRLHEQGWRTCLPVVVSADEAMLFREWSPGCEMQFDAHGIPHPVEGSLLQPQVLLIPVNACDQSGYRLGYGGGYFDRTLADMVPRPFAIGIGFELCRVSTIHPEAHDVPLDCLVTEDGCYDFRR